MKTCDLCGGRVRKRVVAWLVGGGHLVRSLVCSDCASHGVLVISEAAGDVISSRKRQRKARVGQ